MLDVVLAPDPFTGFTYDDGMGAPKVVPGGPSVADQQAAIVAGVLNSQETVDYLAKLSETFSGFLTSLEGPLEAVNTAAKLAIDSMRVTKEMGASLAKSVGSVDMKQFVDDVELAMTDAVRGHQRPRAGGSVGGLG
jgi:hypothetical protein